MAHGSVIAGADWFEGTWLTVIDDGKGNVTVRRFAEFEEFLSWPDLELLVIDVPIGLPDRGARACDLRARQILGLRRSSVFPAPIRPVLNARNHQEACRIWESIDGKRCSIQEFGIYPMVASVDRHMSSDLQGLIREGHPELSFAHMNGGTGLEHSKHSSEGQQHRVSLLRPQFPDLDVHFERVGEHGRIDLLDAFAMLLTARRAKEGVAISIPDQPEYDSRGLRMEMVA